MTKLRKRLGFAAALCVIAFAVGCATTNAGGDWVAQNRERFFATPLQPQLPGQAPLAAAEASMWRADAERAGELAAIEPNEAIRIHLSLMSGLAHFRLGEWGPAAEQFSSVGEQCSAAGARAPRECAIGRVYAVRNLGFEILSGAEMGAPRGTPPSAMLNADHWRSLAAVAARYRESVFDPWRATPVDASATTAAFERLSRTRGLCSFMAAYDAMPTWQTEEAAAEAFTQSFNAIRMTALPGLESVGAGAPPECATRDNQCALAAWETAREACRVPG